MGLSGFPPVLGNVQVPWGVGGVSFFGWVGDLLSFVVLMEFLCAFVCLWQALFVHEKIIFPSG